MGAFASPKFVSEFAFRTKLNYYNLRLQQVTDENEKVKLCEQIKNVKKEMSKRGFYIDDYYEITQLINSLIGLLVFPETEGYDSLSTDPGMLKKQFPVLAKYVNGEKGSFSFSYEYNVKHYKYNNLTRKHELEYVEHVVENVSPKYMLQHLRNAVAHERMGIKPVNGSVNGDNIIKQVEFSDSGKGRDNHFKMVVNVEDLEPMLMEISNVLIELAK